MVESDDTSLHDTFDMEPAYPMPKGGRVPNLNLAGEDMMNVASGMSILPPMPDPPPPLVMMPTLKPYEIEVMGIDPQETYKPLNLAGVAGFPPPYEVAKPDDLGSINLPDYYGPDFTVPDIQKNYDLACGLDYHDEFAPDPLMPDITAYRKPHGLDIMDNGVLAVDPSTDDLTQADAPSGLEINNHPLDPDPLLPDLQDPQLMPEVWMKDRPGEMDEDAIDDFKETPDGMSDKDYPQSQMDARGDNSRRARKMSLLSTGLADDSDDDDEDDY